jgi:phosphohistidine phosphatase
MKKTLLIMRHGDAVNPSPGVPDFERRLSDHGLNQAIKAGKHLAEAFGGKLGKIVHSAAVRTTMTAELVAQVSRLDLSELQPNDDFYHASVGGLLNFINQLGDDCPQALLIGHNPTLSYLIEYLTDERNLFLGTADVVCIGFEVDSWMEVAQHTGTFQWRFAGS